MLGRLLLLFIVTSLVELWLLMFVGAQLGATPTIALIIVTGALGASLSRQQGLQTWRSIQQQLQQGKLPTDALLDGLMIFAGALLLITPGILTDLVGFSLLIPLVRTGLRHRLRESFRVQTSVHVQGFGGPFPGQTPPPGAATNDEIIDVEFERHSDEATPDAGPTRIEHPED